MILRLPRWWGQVWRQTVEDIESLRKTRQEAEVIVDRALKATLNDDDEYWKHGSRLEDMTCGIPEGKTDA